MIDAVREANKIGELADLRKKFPPAHSPFIELLDENGQHLGPVALLDDGLIVLGIGYENGHVVVIEGTNVEKIGRCSDVWPLPKSEVLRRSSGEVH